jgi:hypothetical protein
MLMNLMQTSQQDGRFNDYSKAGERCPTVFLGENDYDLTARWSKAEMFLKVIAMTLLLIQQLFKKIIFPT